MKFPDATDVARALHALFIGAAGASLRKEDELKVKELVPLLTELARITTKARGTLVDLCAGKSPLGLIAAALVLPPGWRVMVVERDRDRVDHARRAATALPERTIEVVCADVRDDVAVDVLRGADVACALHACGAASDAIIDAVSVAQPRHALVVPCCYASSDARRFADALPRQGLVRRRVDAALIDADRTLRLEEAGYDTTVLEFVAPTVTPYNLLWRARRGLDERRRADARIRRTALAALSTGSSLSR